MSDTKVKVAVRVRPMNRREIELSTKCVIEMEENQTILHPPPSNAKGESRSHSNCLHEIFICKLSCQEEFDGRQWSNARLQKRFLGLCSCKSSRSERGARSGRARDGLRWGNFCAAVKFLDRPHVCSSAEV
ncbi:kinesin KIF13A [Labeo rohita]|uniref:Kinesin KIF13A n=1 Tax=Labeo rohita TaxID=84645 RepID=A0A498N432_LABRO|nr:kinesin KIF13A [Labeo rohita]